MGNYKPYFVGNYRQGIEEGLQQWLVPSSAWSELQNGYVRRGVLEKRGGRSLFARMVHAIADEAIGASGGTNYTGTLANVPIRAGDLSFTDGTLLMEDDGNGAFTGDGTGTINYGTGVYDITFSSTTTGAVLADYDHYPGYDITGMPTHKNISTGAKTFLVFNKRRCCQYSSSKLEDTNGSDEWTGDDHDLFHSVNARGYIYVTNNVDRLKKWDATTWSNVLMDLDGDTNNDVDTCRLVFYYKERLIVLRTSENGTLYPQRARWPKAADFEDWTNDGFVDAPTTDWIMSAGLIEDDLIVWFENSVWRLKYTADYELPFVWELISDEYGSLSTFSTFRYKDAMATVGSTGINETDNLRAYRIDASIPDAVSAFNASNFDLIYSANCKELSQVLISYPAVDSEDNDLTLCYNYEDGVWSRYDYGFACYGNFVAGGVALTWDDIDETWDELEDVWDANTSQAGYPILLAGATEGYVWKLNDGSIDHTSDIDFFAVTGRLNPFINDGYRARFGWVDLLVDRDQDITLNIDFYVDHETVPHTSDQVTFGEATDSNEKVWVRSYNGATGDFHKMKLSNNAAYQSVKIHAMVFYFKPSGKMR